MINYSGSLWSFVRWRGSVLPKALRWAVPAACLVPVYRFFFEAIGLFDDGREHDLPNEVEKTCAGLFTSILGFILVFRAQLAYHRFWEGITLVERASAVWINGVSNLIAFSSASYDKQVEVATFQHLLARLMSLLMTVSLGNISSMGEEHFPLLSTEGIDMNSLDYLKTKLAKQKVVLQWVQRLVVEQARTNVIDVPPPILSRVFQEFSIGIVHFVDARKLTTVQFPFQFAQTVIIMLLFFSFILIPSVCAFHLGLVEAVVLTLHVVFAFMSVHFISVEIEEPFGLDPNDLPLDAVAADFNDTLLTLLEPGAQQTPVISKSTQEMRLHVQACRQIAMDRSTSEAPVVGTLSSDRSVGSFVRHEQTWRKVGAMAQRAADYFGRAPQGTGTPRFRSSSSEEQLEFRPARRSNSFLRIEAYAEATPSVIGSETSEASGASSSGPSMPLPSRAPPGSPLELQQQQVDGQAVADPGAASSGVSITNGAGGGGGAPGRRVLKAQVEGEGGYAGTQGASKADRGAAHDQARAASSGPPGVPRAAVALGTLPEVSALRPVDVRSPAAHPQACANAQERATGLPSPSTPSLQLREHDCDDSDDGVLSV